MPKSRRKSRTAKIPKKLAKRVASVPAKGCACFPKGILAFFIIILVFVDTAWSKWTIIIAAAIIFMLSITSGH